MSRCKRTYSLLSLLLLLITCVMSPQLHAQQYAYIHYGPSEGLAGSTVHGITQDKDGYIWFATETGLSRFDGSHFKNFTIADGLPGNELFGLFADSRNRIWMTCMQPVVCYYQNGQVHNQLNDSILARIKLRGNLKSIGENAAGDILLSGYYDEIVVRSNGRIEDIYNNGRFCNGCFQAVRGHGACRAAILKQDLLPYSRRDYSCLYMLSASGQGRYLMLLRDVARFRSPDTLVIYDTRHINPTSQCPLPPNVWGVQVLNDSIVFFFKRYGGIIFYDPGKNKLSVPFLKDYIVQYVMEDTEHNLWFSTKGAGVFKLSRFRVKNYVFRQNGVRNILKQGNSIFVGTDNEGYWQMPAVRAGDFYVDSGAVAKEVQGHPGMLEHLSDNAYINFSGSNFFHFKAPVGSLKSMQVFQDTALVTSSSYCLLVQISTARILDTLLAQRATCARRWDGQYYIGTPGGLYAVKPGASPCFLGAQDTVLRSQISGLAADGQGILWISTFEHGIAGYRHGKLVAAFHQRNGMSSDICRCLYVHGHYLWVGTDKGLNRIDISREHYGAVTKYTWQDGLNSNEISTVFCDSNIVYAGTPSGLNVFDERSMPAHAPCKVLLTGIMSSGQMQPVAEGGLRLPHNDNSIQFDYCGISYLSGGDILYEYRLLGLSDLWHTTRQTSLSYLSLPSGVYVLQLRAINKFGDKSDLLEYRFEVQQLLREKLWFRLCVVLLIVICTAALVAYGLKLQHRKERNKIMTAQQLMQLEQMALRAQMNPHFIFNCLNSMQQYILRQDVKSANYYLTKFAALVRQTLDNSAKVYITLQEELTYLANYLELESVQLGHTFHYHIDVADDIDRKTLVPNMVLQPYVENAVKHGVSNKAKDGRITIQFRSDAVNGGIECIIEDNGPGIVPAGDRELQQAQRRPHGMSITDRRIHILNQMNHMHRNIQISVTNLGESGEQTRGTRVRVWFGI